MSNIVWPSASEFTAELGRAKITEFIEKVIRARWHPQSTRGSVDMDDTER